MLQTSTPTKQPSKSPTKKPHQPQPTGGVAQQASYDFGLTVPRCSAYGTECNSLNLLNGRGTLMGGNEENAPNTLDLCADGNLGNYHIDESIEKIVVRSGEVDGTGSGVDMVEGGRATITATVSPWDSGSSDYASFFYASDAFNPIWTLIGTKQPVGGGVQEIKVTYTLPTGRDQAVRVTFWYNDYQWMNGACSSGSYDDNDDLVFRVKSNSSFTAKINSVNLYKNGTVDTKETLMLHVNGSGKS